MLMRVRRAVCRTSGSRDSLGSAAAISALLSITGGPGDSRELRSPVPTKELEGREIEFIIKEIMDNLNFIGITLYLLIGIFLYP